MPHLLYMTENKSELAELLNVPEKQIQIKGVALVVCELLPATAESEEQAAEKISSTYCRPSCGYYRDCQLRGYQIMCFNPQSPYLAEFKKIFQKK